MSEASFAAIDAGLDAVSSLSEENARLRALLAAQTPSTTTSLAPSVSIYTTDAAHLAAELAATKAAQEEMARELAAMKASHQSVIVSHVVEDRSSELDLLRSSLATLASELQLEKERVAEIEAQRREEEEKVATLRSKMEESRRALMRLQGESARRGSSDMMGVPVRRGSGLDNAPRRRSSLGLAPVNLPVGLGLAVDQQTGMMSTSPSNKPTPLSRFAHRRGSASISITPESREEDDRTARLRDLRLGLTTTKIASRRSSLVSGVPEFLNPTDFDFDQTSTRGRLGSFTYGGSRHSSISEEGGAHSEPISRPPSAPLRAAGRKDSMAVFENWSRRSSTDSSGGYANFGPYEGGEYSPSMDDHEELRNQLQGLRIQLAEAEEGRRASDMCVKALKDFISTRPTDQKEGNISLPPLPTDSVNDTLEAPRRPSSSRWSIPRLSLGGGGGSRRESNTSTGGQTSPNLTTYTRRGSAASASSHSTYLDKTNLALGTSSSSSTTLAAPSASSSTPIFGAFSFSALVSRSSTIVDGDTSPTMSGPDSQSFPTEPSPQIPDHESESEHGFSSVAPSLASNSSAASSDSSRSNSPIADEDLDLDGPQIVIAEAKFVDLAGATTVLPESKVPEPLTPTLSFGMAQ